MNPAQGDTASRLFTILFAVLGAAIIAVELWGVRRKGRFDTLSEHWWFIQDRLPFVRPLMVVFFLWLVLHLGWRRF